MTETFRKFLDSELEKRDTGTQEEPDTNEESGDQEEPDTEE